jgi:hypothetical protein
MHIKLLSARPKNRDKKCSWSKFRTLYGIWVYTISFLPNNNKTGNDKMKFSLWLHTMKESILVNGNIIYITLLSRMTIILLSFPLGHFMATVTQSYIIVISIYI